MTVAPACTAASPAALSKESAGVFAIGKRVSPRWVRVRANIRVVVVVVRVRLVCNRKASLTTHVWRQPVEVDDASRAPRLRVRVSVGVISRSGSGSGSESECQA